MKIFEKINQDHAQILIVELLKNDPESFVAQLSNFDVYEPEYQTMLSDKRKIEFLTVRIALNILLDKEVRIIYNADGKPYLHDDETYISISHTRNHIAVMASNTSETGIDIEQISDLERFRKVASRYLSPIELKELDIQTYPAILPVSWSIKEAIYKMMGEETVHFSEKIIIRPFIPMDEGKAMVYLPDWDDTIEVKYRLNDNFTLAWCTSYKI